MGDFWDIQICIIKKVSMDKKHTNIPNSRQGNKKITLLLVLRALELMSSEQSPIRQVYLAKMVNDIGGLLDLDIWCDRKTVGRHLKLLAATGYNIVIVKGKGCYLKSSRFTQSESETIIALIEESKLPSTQKAQLIAKLIMGQEIIDKEALRKKLQ